jgi:AbrB family looped-hinge helix DNA binding protein
MALVRLLRGGQVTLPAELRQKLQVKEGDYLQAEVVENGMLLKPVAFVSRGAGLEGDPRGAAARTLPRPRAATQSRG